jgi:hypothetical protein
MNVIFNGPPGSGKDEGCEFLATHYGYKHLSFKEELFTDTISLFRVSREWFFEGYDNRAMKERSEEMLGGFSRREAMIFTSENVIKKIFGKDHYGKKTAENVNSVSSYCFSDGGFIEEVMPVINNLGKENICIVQIFRDGCSFSSDSRNYLNGHIQDKFILNHQSEVLEKGHNVLPVRSYQIHNNGTVNDFHQTIRKIIRKEVNAKEKEGYLFRKSL